MCPASRSGAAWTPLPNVYEGVTSAACRTAARRPRTALAAADVHATPAVPGAECGVDVRHRDRPAQGRREGAGGDLADHLAVGEDRVAGRGTRRPSATSPTRTGGAEAAPRRPRRAPYGRRSRACLVELHDPARARRRRASARWTARSRTAASPPPGAACPGRRARRAPGRRPRPPRSAPATARRRAPAPRTARSRPRRCSRCGRAARRPRRPCRAGTRSTSDRRGRRR